LDFFVGWTSKKNKVFWSPNRTPNPHLVICGASGTGKTFTIKRIINSLDKNKISYTVIDKHGDIDVQNLTEHVFVNNCEKGINPLAVLDTDGGGIKPSILSFISLLNELNAKHRMGHEQENMLYHAIEEMYYKNKITDANYKDVAEFPDMFDLIRFLNYKYRKTLIGEIDSKEVESLMTLYKEKKRLLRLEKERGKAENTKAEEQKNKIEEKIEAQKKILCDKYKEYLDRGIINDKDFLVYNNPRTLLGLINRLNNVNKSGVFLKKEVTLFNSRINIKYLDDEQKKLVTYCVLSRLFNYFTMQQITDSVKHFIIIDEASFYFDIPKITNLIINIVQEGRKFGLGVILSTQNPLHFHTDILLNSATKMIFSIDPIIYKNVSKNFGIEEKYLKFLKPRQNLLYSAKNINNGLFYMLTRS